MIRYFNILFFAVLPLAAQANSLPAYPFIHANGTATISVPANMAELDFELRVLTPDAAESLDLLNTESRQVMDFLSSRQFVSTDIEFYDVKKIVSEDEGRNTDKSAQRHRLVRNFHVYVRDLSLWESMITSLLANNSLGNFSARFGRNDYKDLQRQLTIKAAEDARERAQEMATSFSVKLLGPAAISEQSLSRIDSELGLDGAKLIPALPNTADKPTMTEFSVPQALMYKKTVNVIYRIK